MSNKYGAKGFWYHIESKTRITDGYIPPQNCRNEYSYFCSQLEWDVYGLLLNHFDEQKIIKDFSITVAERSYTRRHLYIDYRMDFVIARPHKEPDIYVEAKGCLTPVSRMKLQLLGINCPKIAENTHLVYRDAIRVIADCPVSYHSFRGFEEWLNENY
jgi:hypothetical protein